MAKSIVNKAIARVAEDVRTQGVADLELALLESHEAGPEGYIRAAYEASIRQDIKAEQRAMRDANKAGMVEAVALPGLERGAFPVGIPVVRDGQKLSVHHLKATKEEVKNEIKKCRQENKTEDARIAVWERTMEFIESCPESEVDAPMGEIIAAIEMRQLAEAN